MTDRGRAVAERGGAALRCLDPRWWDRRLVAPAPPAPVALLRLLLAAVIGVRLVLRRWWVMADRPDDLLQPVPVLSWLSTQPGVPVIAAVWLIGVVAAAATVALSLPFVLGRPAHRRSRWAAPSFVVAWLALVVLAGLWGSSGKILHNDILLITVAVPLLFAPAPGRSAQGQGPETRWGWPPRATLVVLGVVYFLTGYQKLRHSGLEWVFSSNMEWVIRQGRPRVPEGLADGIADQLWLTQALAGGALLLELTAPVLLAVRRLRLWFAVGASVMHLSIWALLGLDYYGWVLAVWAVVLPMSAVGERLRRAPLASGDVTPDPTPVPATATAQ